MSTVYESRITGPNNNMTDAVGLLSEVLKYFLTSKFHQFFEVPFKMYVESEINFFV